MSVELKTMKATLLGVVVLAVVAAGALAASVAAHASGSEEACRARLGVAIERGEYIDTEPRECRGLSADVQRRIAGEILQRKTAEIMGDSFGEN